MTDLISKIPVCVPNKSYDIYIGTGLLEQVKQFITNELKPTSVTVFTHPHLGSKYGHGMIDALTTDRFACHMITTPSGERYKTCKTVYEVHRKLSGFGVDRRGVIIALGGGVIGDVGGFVAATYLRGIRVIQMPTTLLAQVDASIGGKTGVDIPEGKNLVGAFHQPSAVFADLTTLKTLPLREFRSGLAEVVKYGIIFDNLILDCLENCNISSLRRDDELLRQLIIRSCQIKANVVSSDETEQGRRAILNFGHTIGHAIETVTNYRQYKHGEAISIGMISALIIGGKLGLTDLGYTRRVGNILNALGLPVDFPSDISVENVMKATSKDKKSIGNKISWVINDGVGSVRLTNDVSPNLVREALLDQTSFSSKHLTAL